MITFLWTRFINTPPIHPFVAHLNTESRVVFLKSKSPVAALHHLRALCFYVFATLKTAVSHLRAPAWLPAWEAQEAPPQSALITTQLGIKHASRDTAVEASRREVTEGACGFKDAAL